MDYWFYACPRDFVGLVDHLLEDGWELYEGYSRPDEPIRKVTSAAEFSRMEWVGPASVHGWSSLVTQAPIFETFRLAPGVGTSRIRLDGPGIFRFSGGRVMDNGCLWPASFSHWSERTLRDGRSRGVFPSSALDEVDWGALRRAAARLRRWVESTAPATLDRRPVLPQAAAAVASGQLQLWNFGRSAGADDLRFKPG